MAGRIGGPKTRNNKSWTEARYRSFVRSILRRATTRWGPVASTLRKARVERGFYRCASCKEKVPATIKIGARRVKNIHVDHINPIVDPAIGFVSWDELINRMFCEEDNLQCLCNDCHTNKTNLEKAIAKDRRFRLKQLDEEDDDL